MIKVYTGTLLPHYSYVPLLYPNRGFQKKQSLLFISSAFKMLMQPVVEVVNDPAQADFFLLPHNYFQVKRETEYLEKFKAHGASLGKRIIVFAYGDRTDKMPFDGGIVLRTSQYRRDKLANEIIMPAYAEDLGNTAGVAYRAKGSKPVVSFCGWVDHKNVATRMKFNTKLLLNMIRFGSTNDSRLQGVYFRRRAIRKLAKSADIDASFIIRSSYSGHQKTIGLDEAEARRQFIDNMKDSDLALSVKGDGNFSYRFYEALSMGRLPLFIDTDCVLPLEDLISYDKFMLRIPHENLKNIGREATRFYGELTDDEYLEKQKQARDAFEHFLRIDKFFEYVFSGKDDLLRRSGYGGEAESEIKII